MRDIILHPDHLHRAGITGVLGHPRHGRCIITIHPVTLACMHFHLMYIGTWICLCERIKGNTPLCSHFVAIKRAIVATNMDGKRQVAQSIRPGVVWMTSHHGCGCKSIGHARRDLINAVAACAVSHEIHTIRVHTLANHQIFDQPRKQSVDWRLMP